MKTTEFLTHLLHIDTAVLRHLRGAIDELLASRTVEKPQPAPARRAIARPPVPPVVTRPSRLPQALAPMRPPRPGSLRADLYDILAAQPTMTRAEIVDAVARIRPFKDRDLLEKKIHETLNRPNDPAIQRVSRGVYRFISR